MTRPHDTRERLDELRRTHGAVPARALWCAWCGADLPADRRDVGTCDTRCGASLREDRGW